MDYDEQHQTTLNHAVSLIRENVDNLVAILVFGSFGSKYEREDSDLDLAIITKENTGALDPVRLWKLAQTIAIKINRDVDLIDLREASTVLNFQVLSTGTLLHCTDELGFAKYDALMLSMYLRFQEERKEILEDFDKKASHGR